MDGIVALIVVAHPPLVSVVVPAYNAARTIGETISSLLAQTYPNVEIIVVDDGSTDDTPARVRDAPGSVRLVSQPNAGAAAARNHGIEVARGEYLGFLDADDIWLREKVARQVSALEADPSLGVVQSGAVYVDFNLRPLEVRRCPARRLSLWDVIEFRGVVAMPSSLLMRRSAVAVAGPQDPRFEGKDEWEWAMRLARFAGLGGVPEPLMYRRVFRGSMSSSVDSHIEPGLAVLSHLFSDPTLPPEIRSRRRRAYASFYTMLAGGYFAAGQPGPFLRWTIRALVMDSTRAGYMIGVVARRFRRRRSLGDIGESIGERTGPLA